MWPSDQDRALFLVAAFTGLRLGELLALRWQDLYFAGQSVHPACKPPAMSSFDWAGQDSNLGATDYESAALTN